MKKWIKAKRVLNILLGSSVGIYVGMVLWRVLDYLMNKDRYMSYSAPWYTSIIVISIFWGIVIVIEVVEVEEQLMKCPCCGSEMESGVVQSARTIFFTTKEHKNWFLPDVASGEEVTLSSHNWTRPTCKAYHCGFCQKVVIDYAGENAKEK